MRKNDIGRGVAHALLGVVCVVALLLFPRLYLAGAGTALVLAVVTIEIARLKSGALQRWLNLKLACFLRPEEGRSVTGATYFLIGATATVILFPRDITVVAILFLAFGDPAAALVGKSVGKTRRFGRTLEGDMTCLATCVIIALTASLLLPGTSLAASATGSISATVFQALPWPINDNLTIPVGSAAAMLLVEVILRSATAF